MLLLTDRFNQNILRYIGSTGSDVFQDIEGHLKGGIPNRDLDSRASSWESFASARANLFVQTRKMH